MKWVLIVIFITYFCIQDNMGFLSNNKKLRKALKALRDAGMKKQRRHFHEPSYSVSPSSKSKTIEKTKSRTLAKYFPKKQIYPITINCAPYCTRLSSTGHYSIKQCWSCKKKMTCIYCRITMRCNRQGAVPL